MLQRVADFGFAQGPAVSFLASWRKSAPAAHPSLRHSGTLKASFQRQVLGAQAAAVAFREGRGGLGLRHCVKAMSLGPSLTAS